MVAPVKADRIEEVEDESSTDDQAPSTTTEVTDTTPKIAAAQVMVSTPSASEYMTPEEALRGLVGKVAGLYVPDVPGKWITPMVRVALPRTK